MPRLPSLLLLAALGVPALGVADEPAALTVLEPDESIVHAEVALDHLSAREASEQLFERFGATLDVRTDAEANTVTVHGRSSAVEAAVALLGDRDRATAQVLVEVVAFTVERKGRKTVQGWFLGSDWSSDALDAAVERGEVRVLSSPSVTTVEGKRASVREARCVPFGDDVPADPYCPAGSLSEALQLDVLPTVLDQGLLLDVTTTLQAELRRSVQREVFLVAGEDRVAIHLPDAPQGDLYLLVSASLVGAR